jgi:hypothetical protein
MGVYLREQIMLMKGLGGVVIVIGILSFVNFSEAGKRLQESGQELTGLQSQSGKSLAEAYYQGIGRSQIGQGSAAYGMAQATLMISLGLGGLMILKKNE